MDFLAWGLFGIAFVCAIYFVKSVLLSEITENIQIIVSQLTEVKYNLHNLDRINQVVDQLEKTNRKLEDIEKMSDQIKAIERELGGMVQTVDLYDIKSKLNGIEQLVSQLNTANVLLNSIDNNLRN